MMLGETLLQKLTRWRPEASPAAFEVEEAGVRVRLQADLADALACRLLEVRVKRPAPVEEFVSVLTPPRQTGGASGPSPGVCRLMALLLIVGGALARLTYLAWYSPLDLSPDEAHYWDWSRRLDWSYYGKGPLVAWL